MTHRFEKHTTSKQFVLRVCKNVEGYLDWICHSTDEALSKSENKQSKTNFKIREMLKKTVAMLMTRAITHSEKFEKFIELGQESSPGSAQKLLRKMLVKQDTDEYLLRIFIRKPKFRKQLFKLVNGYPNPMYPEHAMLCMNPALLKEEKTAMRKEMKCLLDDEANISPFAISAWVLPVLTQSLYEMHGAEFEGYLMGVHPVKGTDSFSCLLQFVNKDDKNDLHDVTLDIRIAVEMSQLPEMHRLQHPYPRSTAYERKGRQLLKEIYSAFNEDRESIVLTSDLYKSAAKMSDEPKKRQEPVPRISKLRLQMLERSKTAIYGKRRIEDKKVWTMDFSPIEYSVHKSITKSENSFRKIEEALKLYKNLTMLPSKVVPQLNEATRVALSLWLFKNGNENISSSYPYFLALLHLVHGSLKGNFCPAFFQPAFNTMAPKITEINPMGIAIEDVVSDISEEDSDLDTTELDDDVSGKDGGKNESETTESATGEKDNKEESGAKEEKNEDKKKKKKKKKGKKEKEIKMSAEEKVAKLLELIEKDELEELIDYINFH